jgi:16S rRNA (guanine(966)-N(2))-methyltransferase RsmD
MRIIGGTVGGRTLRAPRGTATRPTTDKVREALFNILSSRGQPPEKVLDLYAGSGALGLEAVSRGALRAVFVESDRKTCELIEKNAEDLDLAYAARVDCSKVSDWLKRPSEKDFGWIFLDPPYSGGELERALRLLAGARLLAPGGLVICEHEWRTPPSERHGTLALCDQRRYGQTTLTFYQEAEPETT